MAHYRRSSQRSFADPEAALARRPLREDSFEVRFRAAADRMLPDSAHAGLYSHLGRMPVRPTAVTRVLLLQLRFGRSDREALEDLKYDLRWQYMCDLTDEECDFHPTVLSYHRMRLLFGTIDRTMIAAIKASGVDALAQSPAAKLFESMVAMARELGFLPPDAEVEGVDSTYILGAAAIQDCYRLLFQAIRQTLQAYGQAAPGQQGELAARLRRQEYLSRKRTKPVIEWSDAKAREALLVDYVFDAATLKAACEGVDDEAVREALAQLLRLIDQDLLVAAEGQVSIKKGVAPNRQCSVVDPGLRHGRKSKSKLFNGYKAHIAVEPEGELITAVTVTAASAHDSEAVLALQEQCEAPVLIGDNAYAGLGVRKEALAAGTALVTPAPPAQPFDRDAFVLDEQAKTATCPAGVVVSICPKGKVRFPVTACRECPLREQCQPSARGREFTVRAGESLVRNLRAYARTEEGRAKIRRVRATTERGVGHLVRCGIRQGRYFGRLKTGLQTILGAISYNLDKIGRKEAARRAGAAEGAAAGGPGSAGATPTPLARLLPALRSHPGTAWAAPMSRSSIRGERGATPAGAPHSPLSSSAC